VKNPEKLLYPSPWHTITQLNKQQKHQPSLNSKDTYQISNISKFLASTTAFSSQKPFTQPNKKSKNPL
jgi:hypothetical protein